MSAGRIEIGITFPGMQSLIAAMRDVLNAPQRGKFLALALRAAVKPVTAALRRTTPLGPTGNLRAAIDSKIVTYMSGQAVAIVGYRAAGKGASSSAAGGRVQKGKDRAFHQWWLENGTKDRVVMKKADTPFTRHAHTRRHRSGTVSEVAEHQVARQGGYIASSYNSLGPFAITKGGDRSRVNSPPGTFFRKSSVPITIPAFPRGGSTGQPPLRTAFESTQAEVAEIMSRELTIALEQIWVRLEELSRR